MPKKGTQHRVFPYRLNAMSALENTPEFSYATHAIGVNVRKLGILWATIEYQAWFHQTRLAIDMNYFLIFYSGKRLAGDSNSRFPNITALQPRSKRQVTSRWKSHINWLSTAMPPQTLRARRRIYTNCHTLYRQFTQAPCLESFPNNR